MVLEPANEAYPWKEARRRWLTETQKRTKDKDVAILTWLDENLEPTTTLQDITRDVVEQLRGLKSEESSPATADRYMALLRAILRRARDDWQVIEAVPKIPMFRPRSKEPRYLTSDQFERLASKLPPNLEPAARFAVNTGLRMRAQLSLRWSQVDMKKRRAWVGADYMKAGKTHGFPLNDAAVDALKMARSFQERQQAEYARRCERLGLKPIQPESDHVFTWRRKPIDDCNTKAFQDAIKAAGLSGINWHSLRHTFASWAVQSGVTLQELMKLGPWESYDMVLRYAHLAPDDLAAAVAKIHRTKTGTEKEKRKRAA